MCLKVGPRGVDEYHPTRNASPSNNQNSKSPRNGRISSLPIFRKLRLFLGNNKLKSRSPRLERTKKWLLYQSGRREAREYDKDPSLLSPPTLCCFLTSLHYGDNVIHIPNFGAEKKKNKRSLSLVSQWSPA